MYACICHGLTESDLRQAIRHHDLVTVDQIRDHTGATGCCGTCLEQAAFILEHERLILADAGLATPTADATAAPRARAVA